MQLPFLECPFVTRISSQTGEYSSRLLNEALHDRACFFLVYHNAAEIQYSFGEQRVLARVGSLLLLPPNRNPFTASALVDGKVTVIGFVASPSCFSDFFFLMESPVSKALREKFSHMIYLKQTDDVGSQTALLADLYSVLFALQRYSKKGTRQAHQNDLIRPSVAYLEKHISTRGLNMKAVAALSGVSESHFRTLFTRQFGCTPIQFLNAKRIENAKQLLCSSIPIGEVAQSCGFSDVGYFVRTFKKSVGATPLEYRNQYGGKK